MPLHFVRETGLPSCHFATGLLTVSLESNNRHCDNHLCLRSCSMGFTLMPAFLVSYLQIWMGTPLHNNMEICHYKKKKKENENNLLLHEHLVTDTLWDTIVTNLLIIFPTQALGRYPLSESPGSLRKVFYTNARLRCRMLKQFTPTPYQQIQFHGLEGSWFALQVIGTSVCQTQSVWAHLTLDL